MIFRFIGHPRTVSIGVFSSCSNSRKLDERKSDMLALLKAEAHTSELNIIIAAVIKIAMQLRGLV